MKPIREYLKHNTLLFDGAMGTWYATRHPERQHHCEWANILDPAEVLEIHRNYIAAGSRAIKTNTFEANRTVFGADFQSVIQSGWQLACAAARDDAYVFADIGPIRSGPDYDAAAEYRAVADCFLQLGAKHFLFETNGSDANLSDIAAHIKTAAPDAFVMVSYAAQPDGFTAEGRFAGELLQNGFSDPNIDAVGMNCVSGPWHMAKLVRKFLHEGMILSAMPNAGYPIVRGKRPAYDGDPNYFAMQLADMQATGARILGGCCGTTPEFIRIAAEELKKPTQPRVQYPAEHSAVQAAETTENRLWKDLCNPNVRPFAVELDPPEDADITKFMTGARNLRDAGVDAITIADCPVARARMDAGILACKIHRELGMPALPHMTCRDRNQNATQALLLGLCAEGIQNVLLVTGDPIPTANRDEVKSVYNFNSRKLIRYVSALNNSTLPRPFRLFGALNLNVRNFNIQLDLARQKEENGADGFLTQPILTEHALENLKIARRELKGKILGGIIPVVSYRNALFMNNEIAGITVDERILEAYKDADRARGEELAVDISTRVAQGIAPYVDGFYLMTPFGRTALIVRIMESIRAQGL